MPMSQSGLNITFGADHRTNVCEKCHIRFVETKTGELSPMGEAYTRPICPICGGGIGELISRHVSMYPAKYPKCIRFSCLIQYLKTALLYALVAYYHGRRVTYAERNRSKKILERYRTGEPSPQTLWQAIHANIKLTCPLCNRYDVDPLLFQVK